MEAKVDTNATQDLDAPRPSTGAFNRRVGERLHCEPHIEALESNDGPSHTGLCVMGGQMTRGEIAHNGVFRAGDTCEPGTVKYPTSAVAAEPKGQ